MAKSFEQPPKPRRAEVTNAAAAAEYERAGSGHDAPPRAEPMPEQPVAATATLRKRLSVDLPVELHRRFKTACSATDRKMNDELVALIERRTDEIEDEAGIVRKR